MPLGHTTFMSFCTRLQLTMGVTHLLKLELRIIELSQPSFQQWYGCSPVTHWNFNQCNGCAAWTIAVHPKHKAILTLGDKIEPIAWPSEEYIHPSSSLSDRWLNSKPSVYNHIDLPSSQGLYQSLTKHVFIVILIIVIEITNSINQCDALPFPKQDNNSGNNQEPNFQPTTLGFHTTQQWQQTTPRFHTTQQWLYTSPGFTPPPVSTPPKNGNTPPPGTPPPNNGKTPPSGTTSPNNGDTPPSDFTSSPGGPPVIPGPTFQDQNMAKLPAENPQENPVTPPPDKPDDSTKTPTSAPPDDNATQPKSNNESLMNSSGKDTTGGQEESVLKTNTVLVDLASKTIVR
ncbi:hypothetical protein DFH28DRAFT_932729 [Melampsora americana]|nr:hypothetical protein DFH28DRAFT_932729 [Melampsora americana]